MATERERILAQYRGAIIGSMARTLWVHTYVDWVTEDPDENDPDALAEAQAGVDWYDLAPDTPDAALQAANQLAELYETGTDQGNLVELYAFAIHADTGQDLEMDELIGAGGSVALPGEFGAALANMALSTGVSWFDDHKKFPLARPSFECHYDGVQLIWSGRSETLHRHGIESPKNEANGLRIKVSYEIITPESAENGDVEERGWDNEEGELMENVREAVEWLSEHGPFEPSSSTFHHGIWYTHYGEADYRTGNVRNESFHIAGATMSQEQRIFDGLAKARMLRGHFDGKRDPRNRRPGAARKNPSRAELRDTSFVMSTIEESLDSEFKQKVASIELKPGPMGKVPTVERFKKDLAANLATGLMLDDEGECGCPPHENPAGRFTAKGERMYEDVKREYEAKGDPRAAEIAARTVYAEHKKGVPGLLNVGAGRPPGVPNPGRFRRL